MPLFSHTTRSRVVCEVAVRAQFGSRQELIYGSTGERDWAIEIIASAGIRLILARSGMSTDDKQYPAHRINNLCGPTFYVDDARLSPG
jgi:hypothetical protein